MAYSNAERAGILAEAHEHVRQWRDEKLRRREGPTFVTKTSENGLVTARQPAKARADHDAVVASVDEPAGYAAPEGWDFIRSVLGETLGLMQKDFRDALAERDREMKSLRREIKMLRDEVGLERGLANLKTEVADAREQAPSFRSELDGLREQVAKQQKTIVKLRSEASMLGFKQQHLSELEFKQRRIVTETAVKMTDIGAQTRVALEALRASGFDFYGMPSPSGRVSSAPTIRRAWTFPRSERRGLSYEFPSYVCSPLGLRLNIGARYRRSGPSLTPPTLLRPDRSCGGCSPRAAFVSDIRAEFSLRTSVMIVA